MEEIDFEICHSGNPAPIEWYALAGSGVQHRRAAAVDEQHQRAVIKARWAFRTGGIRNWGHNRAVKTNRLVLVLVSAHCCVMF